MANFSLNGNYSDNSILFGGSGGSTDAFDPSKYALKADGNGISSPFVDCNKLFDVSPKVFEMPKADVAPSILNGSGNGASGGDFSVSDLFGGIGVGAIGSLAQGAAGIWNAYNAKKYQDKIFNMEQERVNRAIAKENKAQQAFDSVWK